MKFSDESRFILLENLCSTDYITLTDDIGKLESEIERLNKDLKDACEVIERLKEDKKKVIELLKNSDIDLDDKLIIDLRDFSSYTLDTIINLLQGSDNNENN